MTTPHGAPCWIDLLTSDEARSRSFYSALFDWTAGDSSPEFGGYFMFLRGEQPVAGAMPKQPGMESLSDQWGIYLTVEDVHKTIQLATEAGGEVRVPPMEVADLGTSAVIADIGGAQIGLWQPNTFAGFGVTGEPGAPGWFELHTRDYDRSVAFYRDVLGWDAHTAVDEPEFRYTTLGKDDQAKAGIMDATSFLGEQGAYWTVYFATGDTDATLARASELGGTVVLVAEDTPYGRLAAADDPTGARFKLIGPNTGR